MKNASIVKRSGSVVVGVFSRSDNRTIMHVLIASIARILFTVPCHQRIVKSSISRSRDRIQFD